MVHFILSKEQVQEVVFSNRYRLDDTSSLSVLDELVLLTATGESYGFEVDRKKSAKIINEVFNIQKKPPRLNKQYEGAVLQVRGVYSVNPLFSVRTERGNIKGEMFVFHETFTNNKHKILAKKLIENKAVKLFPGCDEEYLYEVLSEVTESHLFETLKRLASGLSMFQVNFENDGSFDIKEMGKL